MKLLLTYIHSAYVRYDSTTESYQMKVPFQRSLFFNETKSFKERKMRGNEAMSKFVKTTLFEHSVQFPVLIQKNIAVFFQMK